MDDSKKLSKIRIKDLLKDLNETDLKAFILGYSQHDKLFEWTLKSHFISKIHIGEEGEKYKRILDELIKPKTLKNLKIGLSLAKTISIILKDFANQMDDCLSTENYIEAFFLGFHSLSKISYLQNTYHLKNKSIELTRVKFLNGLNSILSQDLAPSFRSRMESNLKSMVLTSYYLPKQYNLIDLLDRNHVLTESDKIEIINSLENKLENSLDWKLKLKTILQLAYPLPDTINEVLKKYEHFKVFECLKLLVSENDTDLVKFYLENSKINYSLNKDILLAYIAIEKEDFHAISTALVDIDPISSSIMEVRLLSEQLSVIYLNREFQNIKSWINKQQFGIKSSLYCKASFFEDLVRLLHEENDIEWLVVYDEKLISQGFQKEVSDLYFQISSSYLENHIGIESKNFIEKMNHSLIQLSQMKMLNKIHQQLRAKFIHRKSLKSLIQ